MSNSSLGSHASYDSLKTVAGQVEQWVHRSQMKQAEADLKTGRRSAEQSSNNVEAVATQRLM